MKTPVYDFVSEYLKRQGTRAHMPGHKGQGCLGIEDRDITEIEGADVLAESDGILGESQRNASALFRTGATLYSTEGSSLGIKAMLYTAFLAWKSDQISRRTSGQEPGTGIEENQRPLVLAARNVHRAMIDACGLLDLEVAFFQTESDSGICSATVTPQLVEKELQLLFVENEKKSSDVEKQKKKRKKGQSLKQQSGLSSRERLLGVYVTSPDYLGQQCDIQGLAEVCHRYGVPLLVDNAHGAYLAFLEPSQHPIALGADICCDSAHKTLPVLTGGAYLHLHERMAGEWANYARKGLSLFGSTSPSYLILQSLDLCNRYLAGQVSTEFFSSENPLTDRCQPGRSSKEKYSSEQSFGISKCLEKRLSQLMRCVERCRDFREKAEEMGLRMLDSEPLKLVFDANASGYDGLDIAQEMRGHGIESEYADHRYVVWMVTPQNTEQDWQAFSHWLQQTRLKQKRQVIQSAQEKSVCCPIEEGNQARQILQGEAERQMIAEGESAKALIREEAPLQPAKRGMSIRQAMLSPSEKISVEKARGRILAQETVSCPPAIPIAVSGEIITAAQIRLFQQYGIREISVVKGQRVKKKQDFGEVSEQRSRTMRRIKSKDTSIELVLRKELWKRGIRYRKNDRSLPGTPDIAITKYRIAIFCDSEFFHGKDWEVLRPRLEKGHNADYWVDKIEKNRRRDRMQEKQLLFLGWTIIRFWGKDILKKPEECVRVVEEAIFDQMIDGDVYDLTEDDLPEGDKS